MFCCLFFLRLCYSNWKGHNEGKCTEFQKTNLSKVREQKEDKGAEGGDDFRRYQYYFNRFDSHAKAITFAEMMLEKTGLKMKQLQTMAGEGRRQVDFLQKAVLEVIEGRKLLQWSYPWCYYMDEDSNLYRFFRSHQVVDLQGSFFFSFFALIFFLRKIWRNSPRSCRK